MAEKTEFMIIRGERRHLQHRAELSKLRRTLSLDHNVTSDPLWFAISCTEAKQNPVTILLKRAGQLVGAVMLREQTRFGIPLGYYFACDAAGDEFIVSAPGERAACLRQCLDILMRSCSGAIISIASRGISVDDLSSVRAVAESASRYRLELKATFDKTLIQFGSHTRRNLRYYARNLLKINCRFLSELTQEEIQAAARELIRHSEFGMTERLLNSNIQALREVSGMFAMGLRSPAGEWLSLLAGWRSENKTYILFQMNHTGYRKYSLSTAMRSFLIRNEIAAGSRDIIFVSYGNKYFEGGCTEDIRIDLLVSKDTWRMRAFTALAPRILPPEHRLLLLLRASEPNRTVPRADGVPDIRDTTPTKLRA